MEFESGNDHGRYYKASDEGHVCDVVDGTIATQEPVSTRHRHLAQRPSASA